MGKLDGKVAIITGSTSGMGRDTAYLFAKEGAKVVVTGRNEARAREVVDKIKADGGEAIYVLADAADKQFAQVIFDAAMETYGTVDVLMNNAGMLSLAQFETITAEEFMEDININVTSALMLSQKVAPVMKAKGVTLESIWPLLAKAMISKITNTITNTMATVLYCRLR